MSRMTNGEKMIWAAVFGKEYEGNSKSIMFCIQSAADAIRDLRKLHDDNRDLEKDFGFELRTLAQMLEQPDNLEVCKHCGGQLIGRIGLCKKCGRRTPREKAPSQHFSKGGAEQ